MYRSRTSRFANAIMLPINPAAIIILGVYTILWGVWVSNPFWEVFSQADLYSRMSEVSPGNILNSLSFISPEAFWGVGAILTGISITYGAITRRFKPLTYGALAGASYWLSNSMMYFMGDPKNTGGITSLMIMVYCSFIYLNIRVNYK